MYARGVNDEEKCCGQCGRGRRAEKARIFPDRRGFAQVANIYHPRGKVMLDADLTEIYGYSTKDFNRQVKNNIERFAEDFRFQLTKREVEELRSKKFTAITDANDAKDLR